MAKERRRLASFRRRTPKFTRPEAWRLKRLGEAWRKPKGLDNKMRLRIKGHPPIVGIGYGTSKDVRGLHPSGFEEVLVHNVKELEKINPAKQVARIAHTVGSRKRSEMMKRAEELKITVLNPFKPPQE